MRRHFAGEELRSVFALAAPIAALQTGLILQGTVATLFAGHLGAQAIATVGLAGSTYFMILITAFGILLGIDPLSARAFGAGRRDECAEVLVHALVVALAAAVPVFAALSASGRFLAWVGIEPSLAATTAAYLKILRWGLFPALLFTACRQYLQTLSVTMPQLAAVLAADVVGAVLDYALMFGHFGLPALGVSGAAWAALGGYGVMLVVVAAAAAWQVRASGWRWSGLKPAMLWELVRLGVPAAGQMVAESGAFSLTSLLCGRMGAVASAAHQIVLNLAGLSFMVPLGVSHAAAVRVGQGIGHHRPDRAARSGWAALAMGVAFMSLTCLAYIFLPRAILGLYTTDAAVLDLGVKLLVVAGFFQVFDATQVVMTGALRGLGETRVPMLANAVGYWAVGLPVGVYLAFAAGRGALGLWIGLCLGLCSVAVALLWVWRGRAAALGRGETPPEPEALAAAQAPGAI
ncbi:MAG: MATE family efflux transporter [Elusimicrobia bacterium]|nr:MATE family efflux transporter [Elusimicrobiota bacterium]